MDYIYYNGELYHHGVKGMKWGVRKAKDKYKNAKAKYRDERTNSSYTKMVAAKAAYKSSKAKNSKKADKAEFKAYVRAMEKTGVRGSGYDVSSGGKTTALYNSLKVKKGKEYADKVEKKVRNRLIADVAVSAGITIGYAAVMAMMSKDR